MIITNPYAHVDWSRPLRGNLHCHSTQSDGKDSPQAMIDAYAGHGYGFLMLSDHDRYTSSTEYQQYRSHGMALIPGCEVSQHGPHLLQVGGSRAADAVENRQQVIDAISEDHGLAIMNHPNWFNEHDHCSQELLVSLANVSGIEIYNALIGELPGSPYALDRWDRLLSRHRHIWGFANDDAHAVAQIAQGWMQAFPVSSQPSDIVAALGQGRFYSSSGVVIDGITVEAGQVTITSANTERIVAVGEWGCRLKVVDGRRLQMALPDSGYVRFECWGIGERQAWSQPITCGW